jgi:asparagine synthase (glutamine-hydrolysing)
MSGIYGFAGAGTPDILTAMGRSASRFKNGTTAHDVALTVGASGLPMTARAIERGERTLAIFGHPFIENLGHRVTAIGDVAAILIDRLAADRVGALDAIGGDFALAYVEPKRRYALLATDRFAIRDIVYAVIGESLVFGPDCDTVACHPAVSREVDPQQIYNYFYFHMVPGPATIYRGLWRVSPGRCLEFKDGRAAIHRYWQIRFAEHDRTPFADLRLRFREVLDTAVATFMHPGTTGTFLSGGTDSSTISGLLARLERRAIPAFSIGFDASGYDEMAYARLAARHFGLDHHAYYVTPRDVVSAVPRIVAAYDQPFGNASAVPTYFCARLAHEHGVSRLLAGDGGDELFGGNVRYAKQQQFAYYDNVPRTFQRLLAPAVQGLGSNSAPSVLRKARSYIDQASMPMPDRYDSYNLLTRIGPRTIFSDDFLASIDPAAALAHQRDVYRDTNAASLINRMLSFDFQFTLADNDLPKVTRMCQLAGVDVAFPMLEDGVVAFSAKLAPDMKLRGTRLRYFFKRALDDFLPREIIAKEKHGFGLPFGVWLTSDSQLRELAGDSLSAIRIRGFIRPEFVDRLLAHDVGAHPGYYGSMVWLLMMLEQWHRRERPA